MSDHESYTPYETGRPLMDSRILDLPWPYNLMSCVNGDYACTARQVDYQMPPEHAEYVTEVVETSLQNRKSACILGFFRDRLTGEQIGEREGVSRSRIAQNLNQALRNLYHSNARDKILYGREIAARIDSLGRRLAELKQQEQDLNHLEEILVTRQESLRQQWDTLREQEEALKARWTGYNPKLFDAIAIIPDDNKWPEVYYASLDVMDLSTRARNCLVRAQCKNVGDVMTIAKNGGLTRIRNLGRHTLHKILREIREVTYEDLSEIYGIELGP